MKVKDLKKVKKRGFDLKKVLILDDLPETYARNYGNAIPIRPFYGECADLELVRVRDLLEYLGKVENVRHIEKRPWMTNHLEESNSTTINKE